MPVRQQLPCMGSEQGFEPIKGPRCYPSSAWRQMQSTWHVPFPRRKRKPMPLFRLYLYNLRGNHHRNGSDTAPPTLPPRSISARFHQTNTTYLLNSSSFHAPHLGEERTITRGSNSNNSTAARFHDRETWRFWHSFDSFAPPSLMLGRATAH